MRTLLLIALLVLGGQPWAGETGRTNPGAVKALSFVALAESRLPDPIKVRAALQERLGSTTIDDMETDNTKVILFRIRGGTVMVGLLDVPLPSKEIDQVCKWAWYWRAACDVMAKHKAHLHVATLDTDLDKVGAALLQTQVVASLVDSNALASYWGTNLQSRESFLKQSSRASYDRLPVLLWVSVRLTNDAERGWNISTQGMESFDLPEIESKDVKVDGRRLFTLVAGMTEYLIKKGPIINDGETIGDSPVENIQVWRAPSYWRDGKRVYRVVFPDR